MAHSPRIFSHSSHIGLPLEPSSPFKVLVQGLQVHHTSIPKYSRIMCAVFCNCAVGFCALWRCMLCPCPPAHTTHMLQPASLLAETADLFKEAPDLRLRQWVLCSEDQRTQCGEGYRCQSQIQHGGPMGGKAAEAWTPVLQPGRGISKEGLGEAARVEQPCCNLQPAKADGESHDECAWDGRADGQEGRQPA